MAFGTAAPTLKPDDADVFLHQRDIFKLRARRQSGMIFAHAHEDMKQRQPGESDAKGNFAPVAPLAFVNGLDGHRP
jgi:hypothetical protein